MRKRKVKVYQFGDEFFIRMKGSQIAKFKELSGMIKTNESAVVDAYAYVLCNCLTDSQGVRVFSDDEMDDVKDEDFSDLIDFGNAVLSKMDLGGEAKNLQAVQSEDSSSD